MDKHIKILASVYLFLGGLLAIIVILFHLNLFSGAGFFDNSVTDESFGLSRFFEKYVGLLEIYGIDLRSVLTVLLTIITSIGFGFGILRYRKWAMYLGLLIGGLGIVSVAVNLLNGNFIVSLLQTLLSGYTFWVLLSEDVRGNAERVKFHYE